MKLIKLIPGPKWKFKSGEFKDLLIFPVDGIECLIFSEFEIFGFSRLFPFLKPLGHNIAIVSISDKHAELCHIIQKYPKFIYINNGSMFVHPVSASALLESSYRSEIVNESFPALEPYTDMAGNVNPLLIFLSLIKRDYPNMNFLEKTVQIGFPYKKIIDKNRRKIVDNRIFELIPNQSGGTIYSGFKKEVSLLLKDYPSFFGVLTRAKGIKENIPNFIEKKINEEEYKYRISESQGLKPLIRSLVFTISSRDEAELRDLLDELRKHTELPLDIEHSVSLESDFIEIKSLESKMFIEEIGKWDVAAEKTFSHIRVELSGKIPIDTFDEYKYEITEFFQNIFRNILKEKQKHQETTKKYIEDGTERRGNQNNRDNKVPVGEITLRLKGIGLLIPRKYFKSDYVNFLKFVEKYEVQIKMAAQRRKVFPDFREGVPIDIEFHFGEKLTKVGHYKKREKILEKAHLLTKIAVRYILNDYYLKGKALLNATKKAIEEDIGFLETKKNPEYTDLRIYADTYNDEIVRSLINKKPPIIDYDINQCVKFYEINNKYLNFTKESETLSTFRSFLDVQRQLRNSPNSKEFRKYLYLYRTILLSMGIEEEHLEDLVFTMKFFFV